jgi:hypothetical protein
MKMKYKGGMLALAALVVALAVAVPASADFSPASTAVALSASGTDFSAGGGLLTVTCADSTVRGTTPRAGTSSISTAASNVRFDSDRRGGPCTSTLGAATVRTSGTWTITIGSSIGGGSFNVSIGIGGATIDIGGCRITIAAQTIPAVYTNTTGRLEVTAPVRFTASGCGIASGTATFTGQYTSAPRVTVR